METGTTKQPALEEQSEIVKKLSGELLHDFDNFLSYPKPTEGEQKVPKPQLDALAQIAENLQQTEVNLKEIGQSFNRLKTRIRT